MQSLAIIGRPNVGKSTLFNRIAGRRISITDDMPGVTRDRVEVLTSWCGKSFKLIDTAGFDLTEDILKKEMVAQFNAAIEEADIIILLVDAISGLHALDEIVSDILRKANKEYVLAINKVDNERLELASSEFYKLAADNDPFLISATHGRNVDDLLDYVASRLDDERDDTLEDKEEDNSIHIAIIGRPNVGKSSLLNAWVGSERVIVTNIPGTTRDSVDVLFNYDGSDYLLTDTAGIRKKSVMFKDTIEKYGYYRAFDSIERSHVCVCVLSAEDGITERDIKVISDAWEMGKPIVIAINKWDLPDKDTKKIKQDISEKLNFLANPPILYISAKDNINCHNIFKEVKKLHKKWIKRVPTHKVNEVLRQALATHQPPVVGTKRLKFYYMTQVSAKPPFFVCFVNNPEGVHFSYERYLINMLRQAFGFTGVPIKLGIRKRQSKYANSDEE